MMPRLRAGGEQSWRGWCTAFQQHAQAAELHAAPLQPPALTCAVQLLLPGRDDSWLSLQGCAQGTAPHKTAACQDTELLPPK